MCSAESGFTAPPRTTAVVQNHHYERAAERLGLSISYRLHRAAGHYYLVLRAEFFPRISGGVDRLPRRPGRRPFHRESLSREPELSSASIPCSSQLQLR